MFCHEPTHSHAIMSDDSLKRSPAKFFISAVKNIKSIHSLSLHTDLKIELQNEKLKGRSEEKYVDIGLCVACALDRNRVWGHLIQCYSHPYTFLYNENWYIFHFEQEDIHIKSNSKLCIPY